MKFKFRVDAERKAHRDQVLEPFVPASVIAGVVPFGSGDPVEVAYHAAALALDTETVALMTGVHYDKVYYLACPAKDLANVPNPASSLGSPLSSGVSGRYAVNAARGVVVLLDVDFEAEQARCFVGSSNELALQFKQGWTDAAGALVRWTTLKILQQHRQTALSRKLAWLGILWLGLAVVASFSLSVVTAQRQAQAARAMDGANATVTALSSATRNEQPALATLSQLQEVSAKVQALSGHMKVWRINGSGLEWEAMLPSQTSRAQIDEIDPKATAEIQPMGLLVKGHKA